MTGSNARDRVDSRCGTRRIRNVFEGDDDSRDSSVVAAAAGGGTCGGAGTGAGAGAGAGAEVAGSQHDPTMDDLLLEPVFCGVLTLLVTDAPSLTADKSVPVCGLVE